MMSRTQMTLAALLAVQLVLIVAMRGPWAHSNEAPKSSVLLPVLESITPAKIEIDGPDDKTVTLTRDGDQWAIDDAGGYPADGTKVTTLIDKLKAIKVDRPIVTSPRYHKALKVTDKDFERRVRMWDDPKGSPDAGLFVGTSPNYRVSHVRKEGDDRVYEVTDLGAYDLQFEKNGWIKPQLIETEPAQVTKVAFENAHGRFVLEKNDAGDWQATSPSSSGKLDATKVASLIRGVTSLRVSEPAASYDAAAQGFEHPALRVTLTAGATQSGVSAGGAGTEATLLIGVKVPGEDTKRYVTREGFGHTGIIYQSTIDKLLDQKLTDLR